MPNDYFLVYVIIVIFFIYIFFINNMQYTGISSGGNKVKALHKLQVVMVVHMNYYFYFFDHHKVIRTFTI